MKSDKYFGTNVWSIVDILAPLARSHDLMGIVEPIASGGTHRPTAQPSLGLQSRSLAVPPCAIHKFQPCCHPPASYHVRIKQILQLWDWSATRSSGSSEYKSWKNKRWIFWHFSYDIIFCVHLYHQYSDSLRTHKTFQVGNFFISVPPWNRLFRFSAISS